MMAPVKALTLPMGGAKLGRPTFVGTYRRIREKI